MDTGSTTVKELRVAWITDFKTALSLSPLLEPLVAPFRRQSIDFFLLCQQEVKDLKSVPPLLHDQELLDSLFAHHGSPSEISKAANKISAADIDILHAFGDKSTEVAAEISQRTGIPYVVSCLSLNTGRRTWQQDPQLIAVLPTSTIIKQDILKRKIVPPSKIVLLRAGIIPSDKPKTLTGHNGLTAIFADGTNCSKNELRNGLAAFSEIRKLNNNCAFFLVSPARHEKNLRRLADELELQHDLTFVITKFDSNPAKIIPSTDLFISLGIKDQLDINPLLAMAAGVPVIAAKGSPCDFLIDKTTALLFDPVKPTGLTSNLIEAVKNQSETDARSERALQYVRENHNQLNCLRELVNFYRKVSRESNI
jgi:hypothetical protein